MTVKDLILPVVWFLISLPLASCALEPTYTNSSSSAIPEITPGPIYCGGCQFFYEVHASVWWPIVYTDYIATIVYTVDKGSGSTVGSAIQNSPNTTFNVYGVNFTSYAILRDGGSVEYTTLNSLVNGPMTTITQSNEITMNGTANGYLLSTQFLNSSLTGTAMTQCVPSWYAPNPTNTTVVPGLPASTGYAYTTVIPFDETYNMSNAITYGLDTFASDIAKIVNLTVPACSTSAGGGVGTLKVGVTALTSVSTAFTNAEVVQPTTPPSVSPIPSSPPPQSTVPSVSAVLPTSPPPDQPSSSPPQSEIPGSSQQQIPNPGQTTTAALPDTVIFPTEASPQPPSSVVPIEQPTSTALGIIPVASSILVVEPTATVSGNLPATSAILIAQSTPTSVNQVATGEAATIGEIVPESSSLEAVAVVTKTDLQPTVTTLVRTTSGVSGVETISEELTLGSGTFITTISRPVSDQESFQTPSEIPSLGVNSFVTTIVATTSGSFGISTISELATLDATGSYTATLVEISPDSYTLRIITTATSNGANNIAISTTVSTPGSTASSTATTSGPIQVTGDGCRMKIQKYVWSLTLALIGWMFINY